jgi:hypothetical protein
MGLRRRVGVRAPAGFIFRSRRSYSCCAPSEVAAPRADRPDRRRRAAALGRDPTGRSRRAGASTSQPEGHPDAGEAQDARDRRGVEDLPRDRRRGELAAESGAHRCRALGFRAGDAPRRPTARRSLTPLTTSSTWASSSSRARARSLASLDLSAGFRAALPVFNSSAAGTPTASARRASRSCDGRNRPRSILLSVASATSAASATCACVRPAAWRRRRRFVGIGLGIPRREAQRRGTTTTYNADRVLDLICSIADHGPERRLSVNATGVDAPRFGGLLDA